MDGYIEYVKYAIQNSYKEFTEKGFKSPSILENWLTHNLFYLYRDGDASRFAQKHIKFLKENIVDENNNFNSDNKKELLNYLIINYVQEIQDKPEDQLVGPFEKIMCSISKEKKLEETVELIRKYVAPENVSEEEIITKDLAGAIKKYVNKLDISNKDETLAEYEDIIFKKYSKPDILKIMCSNTIKRALKNPITDISKLQQNDDTSKLVFNTSEMAVIANSIEPDIDRVILAMEAIRNGKIQIQETSQDERE